MSDERKTCSDCGSTVDAPMPCGRCGAVACARCRGEYHGRTPERSSGCAAYSGRKALARVTAERDEARALRVPPTVDELTMARMEAATARAERDAAVAERDRQIAGATRQINTLLRNLDHTYAERDRAHARAAERDRRAAEAQVQANQIREELILRDRQLAEARGLLDAATAFRFDGDVIVAQREDGRWWIDVEHDGGHLGVYPTLAAAMACRRAATGGGGK